MDYQQLKKEIKEISEIAASVPEAFREKCFEVLLSRALSSEPRQIPAVEKNKRLEQDPKSAVKHGTDVEVPSHVRAFMRRRDVTQEQMNSLVMLDDEDLHFIKEPSHSQARRGQNEWALMIALKNGILNNSLKADPEDVRSIVQEKGYYDSGNFSGNFKKDRYARYFKEPLQPQGSVQSLSSDGEQALADLIKELTS